jgi:crotonobetainyl-CoA:carnitine CoA-transferase CaiB-like acyl-CoA transferase
MNGAPLQGYRILEIGHMLAGPYCGMLLADLGAEVIKVETGEGDISRRSGPNYLGEHNVYFASLNRNKKSVLLDLAAANGRRAFRDLVRTSHGLVTNLRPGAIKKLGLTYQALEAVNPALVCVALTGFGLTGPYSDYPAYDYIIQAMTGVAMVTGEANGPPVRAGYSVVDNTGGMMAAIGMLAKLLSGKGGQIDIALFDMILSQLNYLAAAYLNAGEEPRRYPSGGHSFFVPAQFFQTADGYLALFITHDDFWRIFANELGRADWLTDERFATMAARSQNREIVVADIARELAGRPTNVWVERLRPIGLVIAGVATLPEALHDKGASAREMIVEIPTPAGPLKLIGNPIKIAGHEPRYAPPPRLGEHGVADVLAADGAP